MISSPSLSATHLSILVKPASYRLSLNSRSLASLASPMLHGHNRLVPLSVRSNVNPRPLPEFITSMSYASYTSLIFSDKKIPSYNTMMVPTNHRDSSHKWVPPYDIWCKQTSSLLITGIPPTSGPLPMIFHRGSSRKRVPPYDIV